MDITFDYIIMHQTINDIVRFMFGRANDHGIGEEMPHIDESIGTHTLILAKVFKGVAGMEGIHCHFEFLAITGSMERLPWLAIDLGQRQVVHKLDDMVIRAMDVVEREV